MAADLVEDRKPVAAFHVQVSQHKVVVSLVEQGNRFVAAGSGIDVVSLLFQNGGSGDAKTLFVIERMSPTIKSV